MKNPILKISILIGIIAVILAGVYFFNTGLLTGSLREVQFLDVAFDEETAADQALFSDTEVLKASILGDKLTYNFRTPVNPDVLDSYAFIVLDEASELAITETVFFEIAGSVDDNQVQEINKTNGLKSALYKFNTSEKKGEIETSEIKKSIGYSPSESVNVVLIPFMIKNNAFLLGSRGDNIVLELK